MKTITVLLIDLSGSMKDKILTAKRMLREELIPSIDFSDKIGINSFWSVKKKPIVKVDQVISITNKEQLLKTINSLNYKQAGTPIAAAIRKTVQSLSEYRAFNKRIVLVTDGQETDGGDYELEAQNAKKDGIECEIHIIGINLNQQAINKAKKISSISGGSFSSVTLSNTSNYNPKVIKQSLSTFRTSFKSYPNESKQMTQTIPQHPVEKSIKETKTESETDLITKKQDATNNIQLQVENNSKALSLLNKKIDELTELIKSSKSEDEEIIIKENEELNNHIGKESEKYVFSKLNEKYGERVKWLNEKEESFNNHDFEIIDIDDSIEYYIECKGTNGNEKSFLLTKDEWILFLNNTKNYQLYFVNNALSNPKITKIDNLLDWILKGRIVPFALSNIKLKMERIFMTIMD